MQVLKPTTQNVAKCAKLLQSGGLVSFPTETVYGLGANALDIKAVAKIFEVKNRPVFDPLIVHIANKQMLKKLAPKISSELYALADHFWPGPLTLVLEKSEQVPDLVTAGMSTVAVRMPKHPVALSLIRAAKIPIAAPSANLFNRTSPTEVDAVEQQLRGRIDVVLDGGKCQVGVESTIVSLKGKALTILRPGAVTKEMLMKVFPGRVAASKHASEVHPGGLEKHYAPETPSFLAGGKLVDTETLILSKINRLKRKPKLGLVGFGRIKSLKVWDRAISLSESKDLSEAAVNLFSTMRRMDQFKLDGIIFERMPQKGIGIAVMDRIQKACFGNEIKDFLKSKS